MKSARPKTPPRCFNCQEVGHISKKCPRTTQQGQQGPAQHASTSLESEGEKRSSRTRTEIKIPAQAIENALKATMPMVDIGINLAHRRFERDLEAVVSRALETGVRWQVVTGTSVKGSKQAKHLCEIIESGGILYHTAGIHPHDAKSWKGAETVNELEQLLQSPHCVASGECGLDYDRNFSPPEKQKEVFAAQLHLAQKYNKPVFCHEREGHDDFVAIWTEATAKAPLKGCVHCFTGTEEEMEKYLSMDMYIGITGFICNGKRSSHMYPWLKKIPLNRLMIETDAPFMSPNRKVSRNEPCFLKDVLVKLSELTGVSAPELAAATTRTAHEFFGVPR